MLKILYQLDDLDTIEANMVAEASNRLGVGEFQLFQLAHEHWYGDEADPAHLEQEFFKYLLQDKIPPWVRQYSREIIRSYDAGELDGEDAKFHRFDHNAPTKGISIGGLYKVALVVLCTAIFMGLLIYSYENAGVVITEKCHFPPCPWYFMPAP